MKTYKRTMGTGFYGLILVSITALAGCAGNQIQYSKLSPDADPSQEIDQLTQEMAQARQSQVDVYAPDSFKKAQEAFDDARKDRDANKGSSDILDNVAKSRAYLTRAQERAKRTEGALGEVMSARTAAAHAGAPSFSSSKEEYSKADKKLAQFTHDSDSDQVQRMSDSDRMDLLADYKESQLHATEQKYLGHARDAIQQAQNEDAQKLAPQNLAKAERQYNESLAVIRKNPSDLSAIQASANMASQEADRLLSVTRLAKNVKSAQPEAIASKQYEQQHALENLQGEKAELQSAGQLSRAVQNIQAKFDPNEAQVFEDGRAVHIRLKGLSFPTGSATIQPDDYALMGKVQEVLKDQQPGQIEIDGRTDSRGSKKINRKLSLKRANSIKDYLVSNNAVDASKITTQGFGSSKPIASEKTKEGRALNRSIDVVMFPQSQQAGQSHQSSSSSQGGGSSG